DAPAIAKLLAQATALSKPGGDLPQALAKLTECHGLATSSGGAVDMAAFAQRWPAAREAWQNASDTVDAQIGQLQQALRASEDEDLQEIAEFGLNGVTGNFKVPLQVAIREIDSAQGDALQASITKARTIVANFQTHIQGSEQILVCDENSFGVKVTIRE